jgi:hypothetical protein
MSHLEIIIPFILPAPALAKDLLKQVNVPALAHLLGWSTCLQRHQFDPFARLLPHQRLLYHSELNEYDTQVSAQISVQMKVQDKNKLNSKEAQTVEIERLSSLPVTHLHMQALGLDGSSGDYLELSPCHIHVAMDHLVLLEPSRLELIESEAKALFEIALPLVQELGMELIYGTPSQWFIRAQAWQELYTSSLEACSGHPMTIWLAQGDQARAWRKLQNEIQMAWHDHEINQTREAQGKKAINTVWLHGGSNLDINTAHRAHLCPNFSDWKTQQQPRVLLNQLSESALNEDWGTWLLELEQLEKTWFVPLLDEFKHGKIKRIKFILSDEQHLHEHILIPIDRWKFWRKANLDALKLPLNREESA